MHICNIHISQLPVSRLFGFKKPEVAKGSLFDYDLTAIDDVETLDRLADATTLKVEHSHATVRSILDGSDSGRINDLGLVGIDNRTRVPVNEQSSHLQLIQVLNDKFAFQVDSIGHIKCVREIDRYIGKGQFYVILRTAQHLGGQYGYVVEQKTRDRTWTLAELFQFIS